MKSFTVAAALERLSPNFRFVTSVYAPALPDSGGTLKGDLTIYGRGDVSISSAFNDKDHFRGLDALVEKIVQAGIRRIEGDLIGDDSYFTGGPIPASWEWDDLQWYYGAEVSALPLNDNAVDLSVTPGMPGEPCIVRIMPVNPVMRIVNNCKTSASGTRRDLVLKKSLEQNVLEVNGSIAAGDKGFANYLTVSRPAELFVTLLRGRLAVRGITVTGRTRLIDPNDRIGLTFATAGPRVEVARLESAPYGLVAARTMKPSQNMYTETTLWTLGEQFGDKTDLRKSSADRGIAVVKDFLKQAGIPEDGVIQWDGSGLSRHNLVTPASLVQLYTYMARQSPVSEAWMNSLTVAGVDGTLQNRFKGTSALGNARGKTGTIDQVSALSGYVTTAAGERLVFSIIVNGVNDQRMRTATIDQIVVSLASFTGKVDQGD
jgi:serine-type D-Ala-D-Ala carboxypeptidase/endopeptidase (penicillin-binding protein 4)